MARSAHRTPGMNAEGDRSTFPDLPAGTEGNRDADTQSWCSELVTWHSASYHDTGAGVVAVLVA